MKIAHVVDSMEVGGAETLVSQMCREQRAQGHEPSVYAIASLGPLGERMRAEGLVVEANVGRHLIDSARAFYRIFKSSRPDVVHLHNPTPTIYAAAAARMAGVSSILSTRHSLVGKPRNQTMERKYAMAALFCDWVVGICDATTNNIKDARSAPDAKIVRVYNGALPILRVVDASNPAKSGATLLFVGRLEPVKNLTFLLHAFCEALAMEPQLKLWIVGDGSEKQRLEKLTAELGIQAAVTFWGQQLEVARFFSVADVFVMSSVSEGLPMSLLQALSLGLPAIVTNVGGMAEVVHLADAGPTVSIADPGPMATEIVRLVSDPEERSRLSRNAEAAFQMHFTLERMVDSYMELYRNTPRARREAKLQ